MNVRPATSVEISDWNRHLSQNPDGGNIVQTSELATLKEQNGWTLRHLFVDDTAVLVQERSILGLGKLWYAPKGPGARTMQQATRAIEALKKYASTQGVFLLQVEPE
ncbi:aminoacyltransferase, partial [Candidatus Saccharibacteria bacterium]|nr:aminoacyltransferase [Candidatus Saccharibacteria bacterium]